MRKILEPIREATLGKATLLGCFPYEAGDDLVDSARICGDIHADWDWIKKASQPNAARFWTHGVFWGNDPDFALARGPETSDDPDLQSLKPALIYVKPNTPFEEAIRHTDSFVSATKNELEILIGIVIVSGGSVNLSDNLPRLNAKGVD